MLLEFEDNQLDVETIFDAQDDSALLPDLDQSKNSKAKDNSPIFMIGLVLVGSVIFGKFLYNKKQKHRLNIGDNYSSSLLQVWLKP